MPRTNLAETLIGATVVAIAVAFIAFAYMRNRHRAACRAMRFNARLPKVDGLGIGTDVRLSGIKIGTVSDLTLDPKNYLVTVHMNIRNDIKLPVDSSDPVTRRASWAGHIFPSRPAATTRCWRRGA